VTFVGEGTLAHATAVVAESQVVVGLAPAERLRADEDGGLLLLVVVARLSVLAPARLVFALATVLAAVGNLILHFEHVVEAARVRLSVALGVSGSSDHIILSEVVDV